MNFRALQTVSVISLAVFMGCFTSGRIEAGIIVQEQPLFNASFERFDPTLGELRNVKFEVEWHINSLRRTDVYNPVETGMDLTAGGTAHIAVIFGGVSTWDHSAQGLASTPSVVLHPGDSTTLEADNFDVRGVATEDPSAFYLASGLFAQMPTFDVNVLTVVDLDVSGAFTYVANEQFRQGTAAELSAEPGRMTLTYIFSAPEPSTLMTGGTAWFLSLALIGARHRRPRFAENP